jgi:two-component system CheB/CheR fusion protein
MLSSSGELTGYLITVRDITHEQKREQVLREMQRLEAVGRLTGGIAHDFNNLLTVVSGNLQLMEIDIDDPRQQRRLGEALQAVEMGVRLNQRLMTFARQRRLEAVPVDINALLNALLDLIGRSIGEDVRLRTNLAAKPATVRLDASEMENAILNLAINARDAMPTGGVLRIETGNETVDARTASLLGNIAPGDYVVISVIDTGTGMEPEVLAKAFDPFFSTKEFGKGTGLGLTSVHGFVRQSGGHVSIESEVGVGTEVRIYLPRLDGVEAPNGRAASSTALAPRGSAETILVVEDNPAVRKTTLERLLLLGYNVIECENGTEALDKLSAGFDVDLVFSDIVMPGSLSGLDLAREARLLRPGLPVLLTTGYAGPITAEVAELKRGFPVLRKPYANSDLARAVASALRAP